MRLHCYRIFVQGLNRRCDVAPAHALGLYVPRIHASNQSYQPSKPFLYNTARVMHSLPSLYVTLLSCLLGLQLLNASCESVVFYRQVITKTTYICVINDFQVYIVSLKPKCGKSKMRCLIMRGKTPATPHPLPACMRVIKTFSSMDILPVTQDSAIRSCTR